MKEIFLVTHPEATHHVEDRVGGWFDSELTALGLDQARRIATALAASVQPGARLYSSDLRRTSQTAATIGDLLQLEPSWLSELREKSYGVGEGKPDAWFRERFVPPPQSGERMDHDEGLAGAETKLQTMVAVEGLAASVVVSPAGDLVAHFDLTIDGTVARLGRVIVNPALRGRGLASAVVGLAVAEAQRLGAEVVRLNVITTNEPAIRAYLRAGFEVVAGASSRTDVTVMERPLP